MITKTLKLGVVGLGRAFTLMLPTFQLDPRIELVAATDPRKLACEMFSRDFQAPTYSSIEALCADPRVEAVYIASPHQFHAAHTRCVAEAGKHILLEKPLAISMAECHEIVDIIRQTGVVLVVGHSHSFNGPILHAQRLLKSGDFGAVRMLHAFNYTDFLYRPRRPEELDTKQGGGVVFSQAAHQIDILRLLGGGLVETVRACTGNWDPDRSTEGAYSALFTFSNGAFASATYSGSAHYDSNELLGNIDEMGIKKDAKEYGTARLKLRNLPSSVKESEFKEQGNYGSEVYVPNSLADSESTYHQHFGHVLISADYADIRVQPKGLMLYTNEERYFEVTPKKRVPRIEVIDELVNAIWDDASITHSAQWALATTEVCLAILDSAHSNQTVSLHYQIAPS